MMAIGIFLSLAHTELKSGHVNIDLLTSKMPKSFQKVLAMALLLLSVCTFALVLFCTTMKAQHDIASNNLTWILKIPYFPVTCVAIVGCFLMCAALLINLIDLFLEKEEEKAEISD
jgi:TRAP-type C4-dicarboxylate transport system permease small subunit